MGRVSIGDLRRHGDEFVERAEHGEVITIMRAGTPVAELRALPAPAVTPEALLARWRHLPHVDPVRARSEADATIHPGA